MGKIMLPTEDNYLRSVSFFQSDLEDAAGVIQIVHGMEEHKERYYDFARSILEKSGFRSISVITYDHMRHEILNESAHEKVYRNLLDFFLE